MRNSIKTQTIQVGSQTIAFYQSSGSGPPVLLVHDSASSGQAFQPQLEGQVGQSYRLVAIDLPGHGQSGPASYPRISYNLPGFATIITTVVEQLRLHEAVFAGWGLGGHIVLQASQHLPDAAGFMIVSAPPLSFRLALMTEAFLPHPANKLRYKADLTGAEQKEYLAALFRPDIKAIPPLFKTDLQRADAQAREIIGQSLEPGGVADQLEIIRTLSVPLAVLQGEQDQLINSAYYGRLEMPTLWRGAVQFIPGAGHTPHWEQPELFNGLLAAFIEDTTQRDVTKRK